MNPVRCLTAVMATAAACALAADSARAQTPLHPGELVIGSRAYGAIYAPVRAPGGVSTLLTGPDLGQSDLPVLGTGASFGCPSLSVLALPDGRVIACPGGNLPRGHYLVDSATGNRTRLPGTDAAIWDSSGDMLAVDSDTFLAIADDFAAASLGSGRLLRYTISTGQTTLISGTDRGDGPVMYRPRCIARLDENTVLVCEFGPAAGSSLPGGIAFRIDLATGNRTVLSTIATGTPTRYVVTNGVRSAALVTIPLRGGGPVFGLGNRGIAVVGGRVFVGGTADNTFVGGFVEVDPVTGDRTLIGGTALMGASRISVPFSPDSDQYVADAPTALQTLTDRSFVFCETFGPNRVWAFHIDTHRISILADLDPQIVPAFQPLVQFTGLAVVPCTASMPPCAADFNCSGSPDAVTVQDIFDFLAAYFAGYPQADINGIGGVTLQDIFDYLVLYFAGCP